MYLLTVYEKATDNKILIAHFDTPSDAKKAVMALFTERNIAPWAVDVDCIMDVDMLSLPIANNKLAGVLLCVVSLNSSRFVSRETFPTK